VTGDHPGQDGPSADDLRRAADFWAAVRFFEAETTREVRRCGLTPRRYLILLLAKTAADGPGEATVGEIAARLRMSPTTVSDLIGRAERVGLLRRTRSARDGRVTVIMLTAEGERLLACGYRRLAAARTELDQLLRAASRSLEDVPGPGRGG
jgi:DNA-binding MarR family transcriptional regulator